MSANNGRLSSSQLVNVGICDLRKDAGAAFKRAQAAAMEVSVGLAPINKYSGYRDIDLQEDGIEHPGKYSVDPDVHQLPAGQQTHGEGDCIDCISGYDWMMAHGQEFGFHNDIPGDKFHFHYTGKNAAGNDIASLGTVTPVTPPEQDETMFRIKTPKAWYICGETTVAKLTHDEAAAYNDAVPNGKFEPCSGANAKLIFGVITRVANASNAALIAQFAAAEDDNATLPAADV